MPLDGHDYLVSQGWSGKGSGLRQGAISRPIAIPQKRTLAGLGKDRDEAFPFWDHLFNAAAKSIQVKLHNDDSDYSSDAAEGTPATSVLTRTSTGLLSNRRPVAGTPTSSGNTTPSADSLAAGIPRLSLLGTAKREAARRNLYGRFLRGPVLGPDVVQGEDVASLDPPIITVAADGRLHVQEGRDKKRKKEKAKRTKEDRSEKKKKRREAVGDADNIQNGEVKLADVSEKAKTGGKEKKKRKSEAVDESEEEEKRRKKARRAHVPGGEEGSCLTASREAAHDKDRISNSTPPAKQIPDDPHAASTGKMKKASRKKEERGSKKRKKRHEVDDGSATMAPNPATLSPSGEATCGGNEGKRRKDADEKARRKEERRLRREQQTIERSNL